MYANKVEALERNDRTDSAGKPVTIYKPYGNVAFEVCDKSPSGRLCRHQQ